MKEWLKGLSDGMDTWPFFLSMGATMPKLDLTRLVEAVLIAMVTAALTALGTAQLLSTRLDERSLSQQRQIDQNRLEMLNQDNRHRQEIRELLQELRDIRGLLYRQQSRSPVPATP